MPRLLAVVFAKGYGMLDDHFCVIKTAQEWIEGYALPSADHISKRNLFYSGLHFLLFSGLEGIGVFNPQVKMYVVRLLHALYSLLTVWFGIKLAEALSGKELARKVGLLLALFWVFSYMSVRNLVEFVCVPPLLIALYLLVKGHGRHERLYSLLAGMASAFAFVIRYQVAPFLGAMGVVLLVMRQWRRASLLVFGFATTCFLILGVPEWLVFETPLATLAKYVAHNASHAHSYVTNPWYTYIGTIVAGLVPPLSFLLLWGFFVSSRRYPILFWPTLAFLVFHSIYPNKQERFILPAIPFLLMAGVIGWNHIAKTRHFTRLWKMTFKGFWIWFWIVNTILLGVSVTTYSKKTRVESMTYLYGKNDVAAILVENHRSSSPTLPLFYLGKRCPVYQFPASKSIDALRAELQVSEQPLPNYVIFLGSKNLNDRIERTKRLFPKLASEARILPSLVDRLLYVLNPEHNINQTSYIYRIDHRE